MAFGAKGVVNRAFERVNVVLTAAAELVPQYVFVADKPYEVIGCQAIWVTASTSGVIDVVKCTGTTAVSSGTTVLLTTFAQSGTAATLVSKTLGNGGLSATVSSRFLAAGDKLGLNITGTVTNGAGVHVMITLRPVGPKATIY